MQSQKNLPYSLHGTPNNAQNTQKKLGVAFSYLERIKEINVICFPKKISLKLTLEKIISSKGQVQKRIKYNHLPSNYSTFKIWRTQIATWLPHFSSVFYVLAVSYLEMTFLLPSRRDIKDISIYITVKFKAMCTSINWILLSKNEFFTSRKSCHSTADDKLLFFKDVCRSNNHNHGVEWWVPTFARLTPKQKGHASGMHL